MTEGLIEHKAACTQHWSDRLFTVLGAYSAAALAAGATMGAAFAIFLLSGGNTPSSVLALPSLGLAALLVLYLVGIGATLAFPVIAILAALPAMAVIWYAEWRSARSPVFYAAMGGLAAAAVIAAYFAFFYLIEGHSAGRPRAPGPGIGSLAAMAGLFVFPGICGGLVYWSIAGFAAGCRNAISPAIGQRTMKGEQARRST